MLLIDSKWFEAMKNTKLDLYEFDIREFSLQDQNAGYFTSETTQYPFATFEIENLIRRNA